MYKPKQKYPDPDYWDNLIDNLIYSYLYFFDMDGWFGKIFVTCLYLPGIVYIAGQFLGIENTLNITTWLIIISVIVIGQYFLVFIIYSPAMLSEYLRKKGIPKVAARIISVFFFGGVCATVLLIGVLGNK